MAKFDDMAPSLMGKLMTDFQLNDIQAAGILGNLGHESAGFTAFHEFGQPEGKGGYGWAQWTGPRREDFFRWCDGQNLDRMSDAASEGFLWHELRTSEKATIPALQNATSLVDAVRIFQEKFERAGIVHYESRENWAQRALDAFNRSLGIGG
jgi:hypothetical protein